MATRHFDDASLGAFPESIFASTLLMSGYSAPLRLIRPLPAATAFRGQQPLGADTNNIGRCVRWALAIEGGTALAIYAIYVLLRLVV